MAQYENTNLINREAAQLLSVAEKFGYNSGLVTLLKDPKTQLKSNEERVRLHQAVARELEKKQGNREATTSEAKQSTETQTDTLCGIPQEQLTVTQKKLFAKLTPAQRAELSQKVSINKTEGQIEFLETKIAIKDRDIAQNVIKSRADDVVKKLGNGWSLPRDVDYVDTNRLTLDPSQSDYDAMAIQMPGANNNEKVENFRLLTGMQGWYRTSQKYNKSSSEFVIRGFDESDWSRDRFSDDSDYYVRTVRHL